MGIDEAKEGVVVFSSATPTSFSGTDRQMGHWMYRGSTTATEEGGARTVLRTFSTTSLICEKVKKML